MSFGRSYEFRSHPGTVIEGETFTGKTAFAFNGRYARQLVLRHCIFDADDREEGRAVFVAPQFRPFVLFDRCILRNGKKAAVVQWAKFTDCIFEGCEDAVFMQFDPKDPHHPERYGHVVVKGGSVREMGGGFGEHPDAFQSNGASFGLFENVELNMDWCNSWGFFESDFAQVSHVVARGNYPGPHDGRGPQANFSLWRDKYPANPKACMISGNVFGRHVGRIPVKVNFPGGDDMHQGNIHLEDMEPEQQERFELRVAKLRERFPKLENVQ